MKPSRPIVYRPYVLTLTESERDAFEFVGKRYGNGTDMINVLVKGLPPNKEWDDPGSITLKLMEHEAWEIRDLAEEDDFMFPLFADGLVEKMMDFVDKII